MAFLERIIMTVAHKKRIALVAHDHKKHDLLEWAAFNKHLLAHHELYATGTTGKLLEQELGVEVHKLQSGPLGGDQQIGAKISEHRDRRVDLLLGPARAAPARPRRQSPLTHRRRLEHPGRLQPRHRRLPGLVAPHVERLPAPDPRLRRLHGPNSRRHPGIKGWSETVGAGVGRRGGEGACAALGWGWENSVGSPSAFSPISPQGGASALPTHPHLSRPYDNSIS